MKPTDDGSFEAILRGARLAQSAHFDALAEIRDAQTLRLKALRDDLASLIGQDPRAKEFVDLAIVPGDPPKLWIDLITYVVMKPDPRTYCLIQDRVGGHETLLSTRDRAEMSRYVGEVVALRLVERQRMLQSSHSRGTISGHSSAALLLAWLSGFCLGALLLLILLMLIARPL